MHLTINAFSLPNNTLKGFINSKANTMSILAFVVCALALVVAIFTYCSLSHQSRNIILSDATNQGEVVIKLSQGFVRSYSKIEAAYAKGLLPNPAIFRSHALEFANLDSLFGGGLHSEVVGFPGKAITREPRDEKMRRQMLELQKNVNQKMQTTTFIENDQTIHRSVWAFHAIDQTCVNCHNSIQGLSAEQKWKVGDLMGAQVVEKISMLILKSHSIDL